MIITKVTAKLFFKISGLLGYSLFPLSLLSSPQVLHKMNNMVKNTGKRTKQQPLGESSKRPCLGNYLQTRIEMVQSERESASSAASSEV